MNRLSTYSNDPAVLPGTAWTNRYTRESMSIGPALRKCFPEVIAHSHASVPTTAREVLLTIIGLELSQRGLMVPDDVPDEERYLDDLCPVRKASPLFDIPHCRHEAIPEKTRLAVFGVASSLGSAHPGSEEGPNLLRRMSRRFSWRGKSASGTFVASTGQRPFEGLFAVDLGDLDFVRRDFDYWCDAVATVVRRIPDGVVPFMIGGDHSFTLPAVRELVAKRGRPLTVIHLDQHLDVQMEGSFENGRPTRLVPTTHANVMSRVRELHEDMRIIQLGVDHFQSVDPRYVADVHEYLGYIGPRVSDIELADMSLDQIDQMIGPTCEVYLSIDVDVIERSAMLTTGIPADIGVPFQNVLKIVRRVCSRHQVVGVDLMEFGVIEAQRNAQTYSDAYRALVLIAQLLTDIAKSEDAKDY